MKRRRRVLISHPSSKVSITCSNGEVVRIQRAMVVKRPRVNHTMHIIESTTGIKYIVVVGGHRCNLTVGQPVTAPASGNYLTDDIYIYPVQGGREVQSLTLPFPVCSHAGTTVDKNKLVLFGGFSTDGILRTIVIITLIESETREGQFSLQAEIVPQVPDRQTIPRMIHTACTVDFPTRDLVLVYGGLAMTERHSGGMPAQRLQCTSEIEIFEIGGSSSVITPLVDYQIVNDPPPPRAAHAVCSLSGRGMAISGGIGISNEVYGDCWILESSSHHSFTWREVSISPRVPRLGHTMYHLSTSPDLLVILGGHANSDGSPSDTPLAIEINISSQKCRQLLYFRDAALSWHSGALHVSPEIGPIPSQKDIILWGGIAGNEVSARTLAENFPATRLEVVNEFFKRGLCISSTVAGALSVAVVVQMFVEDDKRGSEDSWVSIKQLLVETLISSTSTTASYSDPMVETSDLNCSGKPEAASLVAATAGLVLGVACCRNVFGLSSSGFAEAAAHINQSFKRMIGTFASGEVEKAQKLILATSTSLKDTTAMVSGVSGLVLLMCCYRECGGSLSLRSPGWASAVQLSSFKRVIGAFAGDTLKSHAITAAQAAAETLSPFIQTAVDSVASSNSTVKSSAQQPTIIVHEMPDDVEGDSESDSPIHSYSLKNSKCPPPSDNVLRESSSSPVVDDVRKTKTVLCHRKVPRGVHNIHHTGVSPSSSSSTSPSYRPPRIQNSSIRRNRPAANWSSKPVNRSPVKASSPPATNVVDTTLVTSLPPSYIPSNREEEGEGSPVEKNISSLPKSYADFAEIGSGNGSSLSVSSSQPQSSHSSKPSVGGTVIKVKCSLSSGALGFTINESMLWDVFLSTVWENIAPVLHESAGTREKLLDSISLQWIDPDDNDEMHLMCAAHYNSFIESSVGKGRGRIVARTKKKSAVRVPQGTPPRSPKQKVISQRVSKQWTRGKLIGRGTYGTVYTALDHEDGSTFAVKRIAVDANTSNEKQIEDLQREIEMLGQLKHKNIVTLLGTKRGPSCIYIMMEYMSGGSVAAMVRQYGRNGRGLSSAVIQCFLRQILEGLAYLHNNKIIHRDIKGDNLFCDDKGLVKLGDFGASKYLVEACSWDKGSGLRGTVLFLSPEAVHSKYSFASDMWALGCTVIEMMTGLPPWPKKHNEHPFSVAYHIAHSGEGPEIPENCPDSAVSLLKNCLKPNPEERPSAAQLLTMSFLMETFEEAEVIPDEDHPNNECSEFSTLPLTSATYVQDLMRTSSVTPPDSPSTVSDDE